MAIRPGQNVLAGALNRRGRQPFRYGAPRPASVTFSIMDCFWSGVNTPRMM
ncbi:hypothetical protein [Roseovarius sp. SYSU LYC5161]|uniref:hypothetical protein n=1 Tax=Roseovarius halophilus (ex Wu et al. 2025) TaxID=3376060 RepID=UPI0028726C56|nr:hypothetical protein [Roseovarius sp.]